MEYCMGLPEVETVSDALYMVLHRIEGRVCAWHPLLGRSRSRLCRAQDAPLLIGFGEGENFHRLRVTALVETRATSCTWTTARSPF